MVHITNFAEVNQGLARVGRGAGARPGNWRLRMVESGDIREDGWLDLNGLREVGVVQSHRTERHLLRPYDVLVTARASSVQVALVPPKVSRTVAGITLLVVRPKAPDFGHGPLAVVLPQLDTWEVTNLQTPKRERYSYIAIQG